MMAWRLSSKAIFWSVLIHGLLLFLFSRLSVPEFKPAPPAPSIDVFVYHAPKKSEPEPVVVSEPIPEPAPEPKRYPKHEPQPETAPQTKPVVRPAQLGIPDENELETAIDEPPAEGLVELDEEITPQLDEEVTADPLLPPEPPPPEREDPDSPFVRPPRAARESLVDRYSSRGRLRKQLEAIEGPVQRERESSSLSVLHPEATPLETFAPEEEEEMPVVEVACDDSVNKGAAILSGIMGGTIRCQERSLEQFLKQRKAERGY
ncbi:hypothetical protein ACFSJ3_10825 [Corallincola platygyrae]|uniref:Energy transducer TonB n=1 Tax=Corallincola platygyrae TaxID=1193278 RepID=A0ABW4XNR0_9GAMM